MTSGRLGRCVCSRNALLATASPIGEAQTRLPGETDKIRPTHDQWVRVRISSPGQIEDLIEILRSEPDAIVERVAEDEVEVEVSLLGSYASEPMRMELYLRLRAWEAARRAAGVEVEILS